MPRINAGSNNNENINDHWMPEVIKVESRNRNKSLLPTNRPSDRLQIFDQRLFVRIYIWTIELVYAVDSDWKKKRRKNEQKFFNNLLLIPMEVFNVNKINKQFCYRLRRIEEFLTNTE